jgi:predicted GIY-YIG superfamily endonuclease
VRELRCGADQSTDPWAAGLAPLLRRRLLVKRFVYVLRNTEVWPRYYVGVTENVARRLTDHNEGRCSHTAKYRPWQQHVVIEFSTESAATTFERYLKSGSGRAFAKRHFG